jgi:hypothetical protein
VAKNIEPAGRKSRVIEAALPMATVLLTSVVLVSLVLSFRLFAGATIGELTRDPAVVAGLPGYTGLLSQIGIFFWAGTAAVCLFAAACMRSDPDMRTARRFLLTSGAATLYLAVDDAFLFHEAMFPHIGIPQEWVLVCYMIGAVAYALLYSKLIRTTEYSLLLFALFCFFVSVTLDLFHIYIINPYFFEDSAKATGLVAWFAYFYRTSRQLVRASFAAAPALSRPAPTASRPRLAATGALSRRKRSAI